MKAFFYLIQALVILVPLTVYGQTKKSLPPMKTNTKASQSVNRRKKAAVIFDLSEHVTVVGHYFDAPSLSLKDGHRAILYWMSVNGNKPSLDFEKDLFYGLRGLPYFTHDSTASAFEGTSVFTNTNPNLGQWMPSQRDDDIRAFLPAIANACTEGQEVSKNNNVTSSAFLNEFRSYRGVVINSIPTGATISMDAIPGKGKTTFFGWLKKGEYSVLIELEGFESVQHAFTVSDLDYTRVDVTLKKMDMPQYREKRMYQVFPKPKK